MNKEGSMVSLRRVLFLTLLSICVVSITSAAVHEVDIVNFEFVPDILTIQQGDSVHWTNSTSTIHTVTSGSECTSDGIFDSGSLGEGEDFGWHFTTQGTFPYFCIPHCQSQGMVGSVEVTENTPIDETTWGRIRSLYR